jgi:hypothetical protein
LGFDIVSSYLGDDSTRPTRPHWRFSVAFLFPEFRFRLQPKLLVSPRGPAMLLPKFVRPHVNRRGL